MQRSRRIRVNLNWNQSPLRSSSSGRLQLFDHPGCLEGCGTAGTAYLLLCPREFVLKLTTLVI